MGSTKNIRHTAGGGDIKVGLVCYHTSSCMCIKMGQNQNHIYNIKSYEIFRLFQIHDEKVEFRVGSRIGSLANVKVKPKPW